MRRYARTLIIEALDNPPHLLEKRKFWKLNVFQEFLEEVTARLYTDGQAALDLALLGPAFAELVAKETGYDLNVLLVRAYSRIGSAFRVVGHYSDADEAFNKAMAFPAPDLEHADADRRRSYLRVYQGRPEEGHDYAHRAVETYKASGNLFDRHPLGAALIARGFTHYHNRRLDFSAVDLSAATGLVNFRRKPRIYYDALHNLSVIMVEVMLPEQLGQVLQNLDASYNRFVGAKRHIAKFKLRWLKALAQKRFGATRQAERFFKQAFNAFVEMKAPSEAVMISLDIALLYVEESRFDEAVELANHAHKIATKLGMESGAIAAIKLWQKANEVQLTTAFLKSIRSTLVDHATPFGV